MLTSTLSRITILPCELEPFQVSSKHARGIQMCLQFKESILWEGYPTHNSSVRKPSVNVEYWAPITRSTWFGMTPHFFSSFQSHGSGNARAGWAEAHDCVALCTLSDSPRGTTTIHEANHLSHVEARNVIVEN